MIYCRNHLPQALMGGDGPIHLTFNKILSSQRLRVTTYFQSIFTSLSKLYYPFAEILFYQRARTPFSDVNFVFRKVL